MTLVVLAVICLGIYNNTLTATFIFDDAANITNNPYIRMTKVSPEQITRTINNSLAPNRPVANFTFALNYYFHQYRPVGYHLTNILIHITNALLIFLIAGHTLRLCRMRSVFLPSLTAALLWLVHPLHTQSVTYIVQRMNSLAAMFYLLALLCYIRARQIQSRQAGRPGKSMALFIVMVASGLLGLASKEIVVTLPFALVCYEWFFFQNLDCVWLKKQRKWTGMAAVMVLGLAFVYIDGNPADSILSAYEHRDFTLSERLLTQPRVVIFYFSSLFYPHPLRLNVDHDFSISHALLDPTTTFLSLIAIAALVIGAAVAARKYRLVSFAVIWFLGNLILESSVIGLEIIFEYRTYLPSVFPVIACVSILLRGIKPKPAAWGLLTIAICLGGFWTYQRDMIWQDKVTFWQDCIRKSPLKARPYNNLGNAYDEQKDYPTAIKYLQQALEIRRNRLGEMHPATSANYNSLGLVYRHQQNHDGAACYFQKALHTSLKAAQPDYSLIASAYHMLGATCEDRGESRLAVEYYQKALAIRREGLGPDHPAVGVVYHNLGVVCGRVGDYKKAVIFFQKALDIKRKALGKNDSAITGVYSYLAWAYKNAGALEQATLYYQKALEMSKLSGNDPVFVAETYNNLAGVYAAQGEYDKALGHMQTALQAARALTPPDFSLLNTIQKNMDSINSISGAVQKPM